MVSEPEKSIHKKKTKAHKLAGWAIKLGLGYLLTLALMISLMDRKGWEDIFIIAGILAIPVLLLLWVLSVWSLVLNKSVQGVIAVVSAVFYLSGLIWFLYALSQIYFLFI